MALKLRILFTILSAICLAVVIPAGALFGWPWFFVFGGGAVAFFLAMLICKQSQEKQEPLQKEDSEADFLSPQKDDDDRQEK